MLKEMSFIELCKFYNKVGLELFSRVWIIFVVLVIIELVILWTKYKK